jgi:DNA-3-methyladenine glycosylase II
MPVRDQNKIDIFQRGKFVPAFIVNRVREPGIDQKNFPSRAHDLKGRLAIPGELRFHASDETRKPLLEQGRFEAIRHSAFAILIGAVNHEQAHRHLASTDPRLAALIARSLRYNIKPALSIRPFDALAESIAYQQLSGKAAATIFGRVRALFPKRKWLDPDQILATPAETFRAAGLSRAKTAALKDLAAKTIDGTVPVGRALIRMNDDEIIARLTTVRGIGRWTVEMLLLFDLGRPDVWPVDDYGVRKGFAKTFGKRKLPTPKQLMKFGEKWRPYRSVAAWYFWRALDAPKELQS